MTEHWREGRMDPPPIMQFVLIDNPIYKAPAVARSDGKLMYDVCSDNVIGAANSVWWMPLPPRKARQSDDSP